MTYFWTYLLSCYAFGITVIMIIIYFKKYDKSLIYLDIINLINSANLEPKDRISAMTEAAKVESNKIPWYERSVSAIGVVAFFAMLVTTGFQNIKSAQLVAETEKVRIKNEMMKKSYSKVQKIIKDVIILIKENIYRTGVLDGVSKEILQNRLNYLDDSRVAQGNLTPTPSQNRT